MSPVAKMVSSVLRLAAVGMVLLSICLCASDLFLYLAHRPTSGPARLTLKALPFIAGVALFWKAPALAERFSDE